MPDREAAPDWPSMLRARIELLTRAGGGLGQDCRLVKQEAAGGRKGPGAVAPIWLRKPFIAHPRTVFGIRLVGLCTVPRSLKQLPNRRRQEADDLIFLPGVDQRSNSYQVSPRDKL